MAINESKLFKRPHTSGLRENNPVQIVELAVVSNFVLNNLDSVIHHGDARDFLPSMWTNEMLKLERTPMNANEDSNWFTASPLIALHPLGEVD